MYWLEFRVQADREAVEVISALLGEYVYGGVAIDEDITPDRDGEGFVRNLDRPLVVKGYLPVDDRAGEKVEQIRSALDHLSFLRPIAPLEVRRLAEEDWAHAWKAHYHVLHIGHRLVIVPSWRAYEGRSDEVIIRLDPGMAFGTGMHPTTRMCLQRLEEAVLPGMRVLDVGTGSGILALAAARLGARSVVAVETDPVAVAAARRNVALNELTQTVTVREGSLPLARPQVFDLVVANLVARVIADLASHMRAALSPAGILIVSGIIGERRAMVESALARAGMGVARRDQDGDWFTLTARRLASI